MYMNIYEYDVMNYIYEKGYTNQRIIAKNTDYSLGKVNEAIRNLIDKDYLNEDFFLTEKAHRDRQAKKPKNAIILAAGFGMRMIPINAEIPKGLLEIQGQALIERLIIQLQEVGIYDIDIVVGFLKEKYEYLIDKYGVNLVYNPHYALKNNIHSLAIVSDRISNTYIVPCDIWAEENPFSEHELYSWYAVSEVLDKNSNIRVNRQRELVATEDGKIGNSMIGIAYLLEEEANHLRRNIKSYCEDKNNNNSFWEEALFHEDKNTALYARVFGVEEIVEIDTYEQLRDLDYKSSNLQTDIISLISREMDVKTSDIKNIKVLRKGMTNRSFRFTVNGTNYIMRIPGEGTENLINRVNEYNVYEKIKDIDISDKVVYISPYDGYKITEFLSDARECDPNNWEDVKACMKVLRNFHEKKLEVSHEFNLFEEIEFYESLWEGEPSIFRDYLSTKEKVMELESLIDKLPKEWILTHMDPVSDNFLFAGDKILLIDWEYSAMQDPHLDIAMFAIYSLYDREEIDHLIDIYFEGKCERSIRIKIYSYIATCGLLWSNWCEYKRLCGVEFGDYLLRQYRYAKDFYKIVKEEIKSGDEVYEQSREGNYNSSWKWN